MIVLIMMLTVLLTFSTLMLIDVIDQRIRQNLD